MNGTVLYQCPNLVIISVCVLHTQYSMLSSFLLQADFVSVELKDGRVVSKLDLGEGVGVGESEDKINDNMWHSISLNIVKNESKSSLSV